MDGEAVVVRDLRSAEVPEAVAVLDGASRLLVEVFGPEAGRNGRMALYQPGLPDDAPLTAELLLELHSTTRG